MTDLEHENVLVTGATGLVGSAITKKLIEAGYTVHTLKRNNPNAPFHYLEATNQMVLDPDIPLYAVINLAGPNLADKRWTTKRKNYLLSSRVELTNALALALIDLPTKPKMLLAGSAIGYYGLTGDSYVDEDSPAGDDFLATVGQQWEQATQPAEDAGINTIHLRIGVVLSKKGGMLQKLLLPFNLGIGGKIGNGKQYLSWISIIDLVQTILFLLVKNPRVGVLNLVAEETVNNADFSTQLGRALRRPSFIPMPTFIVKLLFGEMGEALLLGSTRVKSIKLGSLGIKLQHQTLTSALTAVLKE
tara:strand:- start:2806 stop:3714 length:909 start_codon:yes stop_codon:yes gene_type:complete